LFAAFLAAKKRPANAGRAGLNFNKIGFAQLKLPRKLVAAFGGFSLGNLLTPCSSRFCHKVFAERGKNTQ